MVVTVRTGGSIVADDSAQRSVLDEASEDAGQDTGLSADPQDTADDTTINQTMALLGLTGGSDPVTTARSARAYLLAVRQGSLSPVDFQMLGVPPGDIPALVAGLIARGLLVPRAHNVWEASPPNLILPLIAKDLESQATLIRSAAPELAQVYFGTRSLDTDHHIEGISVMSSMEELDAASAQVVAEAQRELRVLRGPSPRTDFLLDSANANQHASGAGEDTRELEISSVYDSSLLEREGIMDVLSVRRRGGEMIRVSPNIPFSVVVADDTVAVLDLTRYASTGGNSLLIRSRPLVLALGALCDLMWRTASPVFSTRTALVHPNQLAPSRSTPARPETETAPEAELPSLVMALDKRDRKILAMLAAGASDANISRQMQISQRTVERRVRTLLEQLGATTRFQAGAQAVRRGWI